MQLSSTTPASKSVSTEIKILGKTYTVRSEFNASFAGEAADLVNSQMREIMDKMGPCAIEKIAILAAMNIAGDLLRERAMEMEREGAIKQKAERILKLIESHL